MAKIWFCYEGDRPTSGEAQAERPFAKAVELLQIDKQRYLGDDPKGVRFGQAGDPMAMIRGYQHVVVEVGDGEARDWQAGFYHSPLRPEEAIKKLPTV